MCGRLHRKGKPTKLSKQRQVALELAGLVEHRLCIACGLETLINSLKSSGVAKADSRKQTTALKQATGASNPS